MKISPINKNYEQVDLLRDDYLGVRDQMRVEENNLILDYGDEGGAMHRSRDWELCTMVLGTNPSSGDKVLVLEGFRNPRSILPFYLKSLGCDVYVSYKYHEEALELSEDGLSDKYKYGYFVVSEDRPKSLIYDDKGINLIERPDWMRVSQFGIDFDVIYVTDHNLEHANYGGANIGKASNLSVSSYDEVMSVSKSVIDSWLTVSKCVAGATNIFGSNCDFSVLSEVNGWEGYSDDYFHPYTSVKMSELISYYSDNYTADMNIGANYEVDWAEYYATNFPLVDMGHQVDLPLEILYTVGSYIIPRG